MLKNINGKQNVNYVKINKKFQLLYIKFSLHKETRVKVNTNKQKQINGKENARESFYLGKNFKKILCK